MTTPSAAEVFSTVLTELHYGYPLWDPEPSDSSDLPIQIADVGYLRHGTFWRLFNVRYPNNEKLNPDKFQLAAIELKESRLFDHKAHLPAQTFKYGSIEKTQVEVGASVNLPSPTGMPSPGGGLKVQYSCSSEHGALLAFRPAADHIGSNQIELFRGHMKRYWKEWFRYAHEELQVISEPDEMLFVYACHQTSRYTNVSFSSKSRDASFTLEGGLLPYASIDCSSSTSSVRKHDSEARWGPRSERTDALLIPDISENSSTGAVHAESEVIDGLNKKQTIFFKAFKVKPRSFLAPKVIEAAADPSEDDGPAHEEPPAEAHASGGADIEAFPENLKIHHACDDVLHWILKNEPSATCAIACDDDVERLRALELKLDHPSLLHSKDVICRPHLSLPHSLSRNPVTVNVDPELVGSLSFPDSVFSSPLQKACMTGDILAVQRLLDEGAPIDEDSNSTGCPLRLAWASGYKRIFNLLLERGVDYYAVDHRFGAASEVSCAHGQIEILSKSGSNDELAYLIEKIPLAGAALSQSMDIARQIHKQFQESEGNDSRIRLLAWHTNSLIDSVVRKLGLRTKEQVGMAVLKELDIFAALLMTVRDTMISMSDITGRGQGEVAPEMQRQIHDEKLQELANKLQHAMHDFKESGVIAKRSRSVSSDKGVAAGRQERGKGKREGLVGKTPALDVPRNYNASIVFPLPPIPLHCIGNIDLVHKAVDVMASDVRHVALTGTDGVGKTSIAIAIGHDTFCARFFKHRRYFVRCRAVKTVEDLALAICNVLFEDKLHTPFNYCEQLRKAAERIPPTLLIINTLEILWNDVGQRKEFEQFLEELCTSKCIYLLVTLRHSVALASSKIVWVTFAVDKLRPEEARSLFVRFNPDLDTAEFRDLDALMAEVDYLLLSVRLLAKLKQQKSCSYLLKLWQDAKASFQLAENHHTPCTSLEITISLSLQSSLLDNHARDLLAMICILPAGIIGGSKKLGEMNLGIPHLDTNMDSLLELALIETTEADDFTVAFPIRAFVSARFMPTREWQLEAYYVDIIYSWSQLSHEDAAYREQLHLLLSEITNITTFMEHRLRFRSSVRLGYAAYEFARLQQDYRPSTGLITCLLGRLGDIGWEEQRPLCTIRLANIQCVLGHYLEAENNIFNARAQFVAQGSTVGAIVCLQSLAEVQLMQNRFDQAEEELQKAKDLLDSMGVEAESAHRLYNLGESQRIQDHYPHAAAELKEAEYRFNKIGNKLDMAKILRALNDAQRTQDVYNKAHFELLNSMAQSTEIRDKSGGAQRLSISREIHRTHGKNDEAEQGLLAARAQFTECGGRLGGAQYLKRLSDIHRAQGKYDEAERELQDAMAQFMEVGDKFEGAQCLRSLGDMHRTQVKYNEAERELQDAMAQFIEIGDRLGGAQCLRSLGDIHRAQGRHDEAERELQAAVAQFIEIGDRLGGAQCLRSLGDTHRAQGKHDEAERKLQAAVAQFIEIGDRLGGAQCLMSLGDIHCAQSKHDEAERELQAAVAQFIEIGDRLGRAQCLRSLGDIHCAQGYYDEAERELLAAMKLFGEVRQRLGVAQCLRSLGKTHCAQGWYDEADKKLLAARAQFIEVGDRLGEAQCLMNLGEMQCAEGKHDRAEKKLRAAVVQFSEIGDKLGGAQCLINLGQVHFAQEKYEEAEQELQTATAQFTEVGNSLGTARCLRDLGRIHRVRGKYEEAKAALQDAQAQFSAVGSKADTAECLRILSEVNRRQGELEQAKDNLHQAEELTKAVFGKREQARSNQYQGPTYEAQRKQGEAKAHSALTGPVRGGQSQDLGYVKRSRRRSATYAPVPRYS